jgi:DNA-binding NarL/FixJ family response regulator
MTHVLLADDNFELRFALRLILNTRLGLQDIYEARDMEHVLALVEDASPDCVILDWELPGRPTRERVAILRTLAPALKVIALSARPESKQAALAEDANAFISKTDQPDQMVEIIQKVISQNENGRTQLRH